MTKKIFKMSMIGLIVFLGALFVNIDGAKADSCVCSFKGLGPEEKTMIGGNNPRAVVSRNVYLFEFNVYDADHEYSQSDIKYFGEAKVNDFVNDNFKSTTEIKAKLGENTADAKFLSGYNQGNFHDVVANQCSVDACATISVTFHSCAYSKEIALNTSASQLGCWNVDLEAIDSDEADTSKQTEYGNDILPSVTGGGSKDKEICDGACLQAIQDWGYGAKQDLVEANVSCNIIGDELREFLNNLFWLLCIIGIVLLIILTAIEFVKVITGEVEEGFKKAFKHTLVRIVCAVLLLLLPMLVTFIINIVNDNSGATVQIGANGDVICGVGK